MCIDYFIPKKLIEHDFPDNVLKLKLQEQKKEIGD